MRQIVQLTTNALFPVYLIMFLGYFCKRGGLVKEEQQASLSRLGMNMFLPASLFNNIYKADLANLTNYRIFIYCCIAMLVNFFLILLIVTKCEKERFNRSAIIQAGFRTNYAILGLPLVANLHSEFIGLASLVGVLVIPLQNVLAIIILEYYSGRKVSAGHIIREILRNKQIIGTLLGTLVLLSGFRLPGFMESALNTFPGISSPFLLFCVGVFFRFSLKITPQLIFTLAEKLVITPLIFLSLAAVLGFRGGEFLILLAVFAAPTAVVSFAMTQNAGGNATIAGNAVVLSSVFSFFTLFFWISLFMYLGIV